MNNNYKSDAIVSSYGQKGIDTTKITESDIVCGKCFWGGDPTIWPNEEAYKEHWGKHRENE